MKPAERTESGRMEADRKTPELMAHLVAGFPDLETSSVAAKALVHGGASLLEVQFPFSDPSADGPSIQEACTVSLAGGFRIDDGFRLVERIARDTAAGVFIMSYANIVFRRGVERFVKDACSAGAAGLIVPDLPPDSDEGLYHAGKRAGIDVVPVIAPDITPSRLAMIQRLGARYIYTAIRTGITGTYTTIDDGSLSFLRTVRAGGARIMAGLGIRRHEQIAALSGYVDIAVAGSVFVDVIRKTVSRDRLYETLRDTTRELLGMQFPVA